MGDDSSFFHKLPWGRCALNLSEFNYLFFKLVSFLYLS